jgi:hypothetical protein
VFPVVKGFSSVKPRVPRGERFLLRETPCPRGERFLLRETPCPPLVKGFSSVKPRAPVVKGFSSVNPRAPRGERSFLRAPVGKCFGSLVNHN